MIVAAGVVLLDQGTMAAVSLKKFIKAVKELAIEIGDVKRTFITVKGKRIDLSTSTSTDIEELCR